MDISQHIKLVEGETKALQSWATAVAESEDSYFHKAQQLVSQLGAHYREDGLTQLGFWTPELTAEVIQTEREIYLEVFTPLETIDFRAPQQTIPFRRDSIPLPQQGEFVWGVLSGLQPGTREQAGSFYWLRYYDNVQGVMHVIRDVFANSLPYGSFAPAELYDMEQLQQNRADRSYFQRTALPTALISRASLSEIVLPRVPAPVNILQIHVGTASAEGTFEGLTQIYRQISQKLANKEPLTPAQENYVGYDAIQLLPIEPTIEYRLDDGNEAHEFFAIAGDSELEPEKVSFNRPISITLRKPNTQNWGYDVPILGSTTTNPALLGSLRPDELVDFIATLHNFSQGPIQLIYDLVYGHADNQAVELINRQFFKGPNMYGQDLNHQLPIVRAILLEMQQRKLNTGADGIRIDGGQDFRFFNPLTGRIEQDDPYLLAMSDVVQEIDGYQRLLFTIFEDGRPWPEEGWEKKSTYRDLIALKPESYQWGPLIFAHNTPTLQGFWAQKWQRVCEVMFKGDRWITGCANHDTVRRGNQVALSEKIDWNLGETLPEVINNAYDNPATYLWVYGFSPGLPMDFLNALMRGSWGFFRNTDTRYGVKVVSEEAGFLDWQVTPELYEEPDAFPRLKALGFNKLEVLRQFVKALAVAIVETDYNLEKVAQICQYCLSDTPGVCEIEPLKNLNQADKPEFLALLDIPKLEAFAMAFMEDGYELCRVARYHSAIESGRSCFNLALRNYRHENPWLRENLGERDRFNSVRDEEKTIFYGMRTAPRRKPTDRDRRVVLVAHMGGKPAIAQLKDWLNLDLSQWQLAIASPDLKIDKTLENLPGMELKDGQGFLLEARRPTAK
ncbi:glucosylglycerol hydrolase [Lusitaniella coriacea]|uniref:glucosylglycerol hydrolase n=1 Tax=Lusitaniella coriacea TaxID=1983105 RepID=UPI003CEDEA4B